MGASREASTAKALGKLGTIRRMRQHVRRPFMLTLTAYDWSLARRTALLGLALGALVFVVMLSTDDLAGTLAGRVGRLAALVSLAGGGAAFIATEQARSRGEMRALGAAGVPGVKASLGAVIGGVMVGALGPVFALSHAVDLAPLFPRVGSTGTTWVSRGGAWVDATRGLVVQASGDLSLVAPDASVVFVEVAVPRLATAIALAVAGVGFPLWATAPSTTRRRLGVGFSVAVTAIIVFHLVAVGRLVAMSLVIPPALVLLDAAALHWRASWR
jgi:hypothetical protein